MVPQLPDDPGQNPQQGLLLDVDAKGPVVGDGWVLLKNKTRTYIFVNQEKSTVRCSPQRRMNRPLLHPPLRRRAPRPIHGRDQNAEEKP
jgi:hypothetical protein